MIAYKAVMCILSILDQMGINEVQYGDLDIGHIRHFWHNWHFRCIGQTGFSDTIQILILGHQSLGHLPYRPYIQTLRNYDMEHFWIGHKNSRHKLG